MKLLQKLFQCVLVAASMMVSTPAFADGHFGMSWTYEQFNDPSNRGRMTSMMVVGFPETDNALAHAFCFAGSTAGLPRIELAADVGNRIADDPIDIRFFADVGPMDYRGTVKPAQSEEDYTGVRLQLDFNDPLWPVFQRMGMISYSVDGRRIDLPLRGSSRAIDAFLQDCRTYHGNFNPNTAGGGNSVQPNPPVVSANPPVVKEPFDPRWETCDRLANVVSKNSDHPVTVTFRNQSDGFRTVMWIGFDGIAKEYAALNPGEEFTIDTFITHPWMFTDGPGNCLEMFMPQFGVSVFNITAPNRYFGPE